MQAVKLMSGGLVAIEWFKIRNYLVTTLLKSMQHGEHVPTAEDPTPFQFRARGFMWRRAIKDWRQNPLFGIRFIPEVPSYIRSWRANTGGFPWPNDPPTSGPHNSYLSVLARMGIIGFVFLTMIAFVWLRTVFRLCREGSMDLIDLFFIFVPLNGAVFAFFNVGFESPHNCVLMWLFLGFLFAQRLIHDQKSRQSQSPQSTSVKEVLQSEVIPTV